MTKAAAREQFLAQRKQLTEEAYQLANQQLYNQVIAFLKERQPQNVHCFLPILKNKEVNTWPVIAWMQQQGIQVIVPKSNLQDNNMQHVELGQETNCLENAWGIPEPQGDALRVVAEKDIDIILVPLLTFDKQGHRVGYGKGYYDVFLAKCHSAALKVGLSIFPPISKITDVNHFDVHLTHAITPDTVWAFNDSII